jgi:hypothetical protein
MNTQATVADYPDWIKSLIVTPAPEPTEPRRREVVVLVGRPDEFFEFAKTIKGAKIFRASLRAETKDVVFRGLIRSVHGLSPDAVITYGSYATRFTPEEIAQLRLYVKGPIAKQIVFPIKRGKEWLTSVLIRTGLYGQ